MMNNIPLPCDIIKLINEFMPPSIEDELLRERAILEMRMLGYLKKMRECGDRLLRGSPLVPCASCGENGIYCECIPIDKDEEDEFGYFDSNKYHIHIWVFVLLLYIRDEYDKYDEYDEGDHYPVKDNWNGIRSESDMDEFIEDCCPLDDYFPR